MRVKAAILLLFFAALLPGCQPPLTHKRSVERVGAVEIAKDAYFQILPLSVSEMEGSFNQTVTGVFRGDRQTFLSQVEIDSQEMTMVGMATFGARIYTLNFEGETLTFATIPQLSSKLLPENLLADFQLANWPLEPIREQFEKSEPKTYWLTAPRKLEIEESPGRRTISFGGLKVIDILYQEGEDGTREIEFKNLDRDYTLHITQFQEVDF